MKSVAWFRLLFMSLCLWINPSNASNISVSGSLEYLDNFDSEQDLCDDDDTIALPEILLISPYEYEFFFNLGDEPSVHHGNDRVDDSSSDFSQYVASPVNSGLDETREGNPAEFFDNVTVEGRLGNFTTLNEVQEMSELEL